MGAERKAIVLGGNTDQVPLIQALGARGYRTVLIDYYPDPPGKAVADVHHQVSTLDVDAVFRLVEAEQPAFVTSIGNDLVVPVLAQVSERYGLPSTQSYADALKATNKALMKEAFRAHDIPTARQFTKDEYTGADRGNLPFPLIGKLQVGYGARGVRRLNDVAALDAYLKEYGPQGELIVEEFIADGVELSVDCFAAHGQATVLLVSRLHQVPGLKEQFSVLLVEFPYDLRVLVHDEIRAIAQRMVAAFGITNGPFFFQAKLKDGALQVIEMGARIAGGRKYSVVKATTGFDPLEAQLDVLEGNTVAISLVPARERFATAMLFAQQGALHELSAPASMGYPFEWFAVRSPGFQAQGRGLGDERIAVVTTQGLDRIQALERVCDLARNTVMRDRDGQDLLRTELYQGPW